jgi:glycosyltransferase involved in cell wall biosynthesis
MSYVAASKAGLCPFLRNIHHDTTYSNKMFQYMYYGKPVIASNCTSQQNLIEQANCGFIFKAGDADDLVLSIKKLYASEAYPRLSSNARESVLETYNSEKGYTELLEIYNQAPKKSSVS